tara:strand:- start:190 stop:432 length:243 start_codon:yes stop_codon:yes gene_type:complete
MKQTNRVIEMEFMGHHIVIPKGTSITNQTADGIDENYNFIQDLSWIPKIDFNGKKIKNYSLIHDATYRGILISKEEIETV